MIMFIKNKLDIIWYLLGRNDWVWARMSVEARKTILGVNAKFNDQREDYLDSRDYGAGRIAGGENWENQINRMSLLRGRIINGILDKVKPSAVLEIGPGPGFYTKMICEYHSVQKYVGVDVNHYFLQYLQIHLQDLANRRSGFQFSLLSTDVADLSFDNDFDLAVLISTVHHIPNRFDLFNNMCRMLKTGGHILCLDPSHYLIRLVRLIKKFIFSGYLSDKFYGNLSNLSTHNMCTYGEYLKIARASKLEIVDEWYVLPGRNVVHGHSWLRFFSLEIGILFKKI